MAERHLTELELVILGSGTSTGVPMLGCRCPTCTSDDARDARWRASALVRWPGATLVIDTTPEFRLQMLRAQVDTIDAVLITHHHADHIHGFDDLRGFTLRNDRRIPVFTSPDTCAWLREHFRYIWVPTQLGGGLPRVDLHPVTAPFVWAGLTVTPIPVKHGCLDILGFRLGNLAYISDVSAIPPTSEALLEDLDVLVLDAVRYRPHSTHFHLDAALAAAQRIGARRTVLTHLNHDFLHRRLERELPAGVTAAWDGMTVRASAGFDAT